MTTSRRSTLRRAGVMSTGRARRGGPRSVKQGLLSAAGRISPPTREESAGLGGDAWVYDPPVGLRLKRRRRPARRMTARIMAARHRAFVGTAPYRSAIGRAGLEA